MKKLSVFNKIFILCILLVMEMIFSIGLCIIPGQFRMIEFVLCFIDVDQLKKVNDNLGHVKGDEYLCTVAKKVKEEIRDEDTACRFGGDEMVVFFECASTDMLEKKMEELNKNLKDISKDYPMSISFGMIMVDKGNTLSAAKLLEKADRKMYENKKQRKMNRE